MTPEDKESKENKVGTCDGETCNRYGCKGTMEYTREGDCSCHISPPCANCVESPTICNQCGERIENEDA